MAKNQSESPSFGSTIFSFSKKILGVMAGTRPFLGYVADIIEHRAEKMERRLLGLAVLYLLMFASIVFLLLGIFFLIIDFAGLSRGVVFTAGGLLVLLVTVMLIRSGKADGRGYEN